MKILRSYLLVLLMLLFGCGSGENCKIRVVSDIERGAVYVDNIQVGEIRVGYATAMVSSGDHLVEVKRESSDGEWFYSATENVTTINNETSILEVKSKKSETQKRKDRLANEKKLRIEEENRIQRELEEKRISLWNSEEVFKDDASGLVWQDTSGRPKLTFKKAEDYCEDLEFSGRKDWRLPSLNEALRLSAQSKSLKFAHSYERINKSDTIVSLLRGEIRKKSRNSEYYVRCVADFEVSPDPKNEIALKFGIDKYPVDSFIDVEQKLLWENTTKVRKTSTQKNALKVCQQTNIDGFSGWRLPTVEELVSVSLRKPDYMNIFSSSLISSGKKGSKKAVVYRDGSIQQMPAEGIASSYFRCVKDL
jgi:hypothetical protein